MKIIGDLSDMIEEEIADAEKYARHALNHKEDHPELAATFYQLSLEEMKHMTMLHDQVVRIIADYRKTNGEPPEAMLTLYNYLHKRHIEKAADVKAMQAMYKEG